MPMLKLIPLIALLLFAGPPVPVGTVQAETANFMTPVRLFIKCTAAVDPKASAIVTMEVLDLADGDDQQRFRFSVETHTHEDTVDCLRDQVAAWAGEP